MRAFSSLSIVNKIAVRWKGAQACSLRCDADPGGRAENIAKARALLAISPAAEATGAGAAEKAEPDGSRVLPRPCPHCGGRMIIVEVFARGSKPQYAAPATAPAWIDTS